MDKVQSSKQEDKRSITDGPITIRLSFWADCSLHHLNGNGFIKVPLTDSMATATTGCP
jgi:hypothetical protein